MNCMGPGRAPRVYRSSWQRTFPALLLYAFHHPVQTNIHFGHLAFFQPRLGYLSFATSTKKPVPNSDRSDPYNYTSGRWLRRDALEQQSRVIRFDFNTLRQKVIEACPGAKSIVSYEKKEGGFNRVFIFHTDNAKRVVARLPFTFSGPSRLTTNSEVATIKYLQAKTSIPTPKILDWSDDASNCVGSEYIIMEHAPGIQLHQAWPEMDVATQLKCIGAIYGKLKEMVELEFRAYGSLYFASAADQQFPDPSLDDKFRIGPHCGRQYWDCDVSKPRYYHTVEPNQGPWSELAAYCDGLIDTGLSRIPPAGTIFKRPRYHGTIKSHHDLLDQGQTILKQLAQDGRIQKVATPMMFHPDLHKRNIFVSEEDPTIITAIIDWQSTSIEPAFCYANEIPDFAQPIPDPSGEDRLEPKSEACAKLFDASLQFFMPMLAEARTIDEALLRPFSYCHRTWKDGVVALRDDLIQLSRRWDELGLEGSCPFPLPGPEGYAAHQKEYRKFEASLQLKHMLSDLLNCASDGWVPAGEFESAKAAHQEIFEALRQEILENEDSDGDEPIKTESDLREIWPFDLGK